MKLLKLLEKWKREMNRKNKRRNDIFITFHDRGVIIENLEIPFINRIKLLLFPKSKINFYLNGKIIYNNKND